MNTLILGNQGSIPGGSTFVFSIYYFPSPSDKEGQLRTFSMITSSPSLETLGKGNRAEGQRADGRMTGNWAEGRRALDGLEHGRGQTGSGKDNRAEGLGLRQRQGYLLRSPRVVEGII